MADIFKDFVYTRNTVQVTDLDTSIQVEDVSLFPSNELLAKGEFFIAFDSSLSYPGTFEICRVTSINVAAKTLNVIRAQAGTIAVPHAIVTYIKGTLNSDQARRLRAGFSGTVAPAPDLDMLSIGDQFLHLAEQRLYVFTGQAAYLKDSFNRAVNNLTLGTTELQTLTGDINGAQAPQSAAVVPYVGTWEYRGGTNPVFGVRAPGQAALVSGTTGASAQVTVGSLNFDISMDVWMSPTATSDYGILFRTNLAGTHGYYLQFLGTTARLFRLSSGVFTSLGSTTSYTTGSLRLWRITVSGNNFSVFNNGVLAFNFTETSTAFLAAAAIPVVGGFVGFRYGNAAAVADTSLYFSNFSSTVVGNVGLNNPTPQGWAPVAASPNATAFLFAQLTSVQVSDMKTVALVDETIQALVGIENTQGAQGTALTTLALNFDDLLDTYKGDMLADPVARTLSVVSSTVDDVIDILSTLVRSGSGNPTGVPRDAEIYIDRSGRSVWVGIAGVWARVTYSGPGASIPPVTYVDSATTATFTGAFPVGAGAGDLAIAMYNTVQTSAIPTAPAGWTLIASGNPVSQYYNSYAIAYKLLTPADLTGGFAFGNSGQTGQTTVRVYRNAAFGVSATINGTASNNTIINGPTVATTPGQTVVNWFGAGNNNNNGAFLAPIQSNLYTRVILAGSPFATQAAQDEIATGTTSTVRQFRWTTGDNVTAYSAHAFTVLSAGEVVGTPGLRVVAGVPTDSPVPGTIHLDSNSKAVYVYDGTEWLGVNRRVVLTAGDYLAKGNDYVVATAAQSGRGATAPSEFDTSLFNNNSADPATVAITTTKADVLIVGLRATWQGTGFTATLNGAAMTLRRRQYSGSQGPDSSLFTANTLVQPGTHTLSFSGPTFFGIAWASAIAFAGVTTTGATYTGQHNGTGQPSITAGTLPITLPATGPGFVYLYSQVNGGSPPSMSNGGGLTWTLRGSGPHGSQNASTQWTAPYTQAQAGTTITVVTTTDPSWQSIQAAAFPSVPGDPTAFDPTNFAVITLPTPAVGAQVSVQHNDLGGNEIRVAPASGLVNSQANDSLTTRFQTVVYTSDGSNWFGVSSERRNLVSKTANYTARDGEVVLVDATAGNRVITLPLAIRNRTVTVKKVDASANQVSVIGAGATPQTIDGSATVSLVTQYETQTYVSDGTSWWRTR